MQLAKQSLGVLSVFGLFLSGCETTNPHDKLGIKAPVSSLKANKTLQPQVAHAFLLLKEGKYSEASSYINRTLQSQPKSVIFHILNALTYEKLAENGDDGGMELAIIGYQNAINLDPFNKFAITQLAKIRYRDQKYAQAQEHFANALLIKPNDPNMLHEYAAASYYAYDVKTALAAIKKALELKPKEPLIQRSAAMIYAALGDFKAAEKHFKIFQGLVGQDPEVDYVATRFNDWQALHKSGRMTLAAAQSPAPGASPTPPDNDPPSSGPSSLPSGNGPPSSGSDGSLPGAGSADGDSGSENSGAGGVGLTIDNPPLSESDVPTKEEFSRTNEGANIVDVPVTPGVSSSPDGSQGQQSAPPLPPPAAASTGPSHKPDATPTNSQIIIDCYLLEINEAAGTTKGHNILQNLAVTLNPGTYTQFKGSLWGSGAIRKETLTSGGTGGQGSQVVNNTGNAYATGIFTPDGKPVNNPPDGDNFNQMLNNAGSISGRIFSGGISWAGLTYSLNIANSADARTEIVSRPTLMTYLKKEARFFSGVELINVSGGSYGSNLSRYPIGVSLAIVPETLVGEVITLNIGIETSNLQSPNPNLLQTVDVGKTRLETTARVHLGETIMLGGMYQRQEIQSNQGVPGLKEVPIVQYFFANETTASNRSSIIILLTPRSPELVKSAVNRAMSQESVRPYVDELASRNPDWFHPHTNAINILNFINLDPAIYYEFRSGDILPPSWGFEPSLSDKLLELSSFLYF